MRFAPIALAAALVAPTAHAWEPVTGMAPMLYLSIPLDADRKAEEATRYGFRLTESRFDLRHGTVHSVNPTPERPAFVDYSFSTKSGLPSLKICGVDAMRYRLIYNANRPTEAVGEDINWWLVGGVMLAAGVFIENIPWFATAHSRH
jgi:hypothetical protein